MAEVKKTIRVGDLVKVCYPESDITNNPARRLDGQEFIVKPKYKTKSNKGGDTYQYQLFGAESKRGMAYFFLTDELNRI